MSERSAEWRERLQALELSTRRSGRPADSGMALHDAVQLITGLIEPVAEVERVPLAAAYRRVLAHDLHAPINVPAYDNSAMDGFALRWDELNPDATTRLTIAGKALAGQPFSGETRAGHAVQIMTGARIPAELDTIVPIEQCQILNSEVQIPPGQQRAQHCRLAGEDIRRGAVVLSAGRMLGAADVGLVASLGVDQVTVRRQPRVVVLSTGDELLAPGESEQPDRIYDSNRFTLIALLRELGLQAHDAGIVPDDPQALQTVLKAHSNADLILSSGGVSVGEADFTRTVMAQLGQVVFATLAIRPGRPLAVGRLGNAWFFGLPGNPVAVMVTYLFVVRAALLRLLGAEPRAVHRVSAIALTAVRKRRGRTEFQRGIAHRNSNGQLEVQLTGQQGSGILSSMSRANCMIVLDDNTSDVAPGDAVDIVLFDGLV